jgi:hypothetical protein
MVDQIEELKKRITAAMEIITRYGAIDGEHHKQWCLDQVARELLEVHDYEKWIEEMRGDWDEENQEFEYCDWDEGIPP